MGLGKCTGHSIEKAQELTQEVRTLIQAKGFNERVCSEAEQDNDETIVGMVN